MERRLFKRADQLEEDPQKVMDDVIRGRQYLYRPDEQMQTQV
jgi:hypothetical protein